MHTGSTQYGAHEYSYVKHLQSGSFGEVYEGHRTADGVRCALKWLPVPKAESMLRNKGSAVRPGDEVCILQSLTHTNIVALWCAHVTSATILMVMELCAEDLLQLLLRDGPLGRAASRTCVSELLCALAYLQTHRVAHRDVKLENLLLAASPCQPGALKLGDFGIARHCDSLCGCTTHIGSADYMAPEVQVHEGREYGFVCDIWSCGVVAYACLTALPPYEEINYDSARRAGIVMPDERVDAGGWPHPCKFIRRCLVVSPAERPCPTDLAESLW